MAKDSTVTGSSEQINTSIQNAAQTTSADIQDLNASLTGAIAALGDGIKLSAKGEEPLVPEEKEPEITVEKLKTELDGLRIMSPEMGEMAENLIGINTSTQTFSDLASQNTQRDIEKEGITPDVKMDPSAKETGALAGLTDIESITGTGFSIVSNILKDLYELFSVVLEGVAAGQVSAALLAANAGTTIEKKEEEGGGAQKESQGVLAAFFQGLSGPLESVAGSILMLSISFAILNAIQLNAQLLGQVIILETFMLTTFAALSVIKNRFLQEPDLIDAEGTKQGSLTSVVNDFSKMVMLVVGAMTACALMVEVLKVSWMQVLIGLVIVFGTALITMVALTAVSALMSEMLGENATIMQTIKEFEILVWSIVALSLVCWLFWPLIQEGLMYAGLIMLMTMGVMLGLILMISKIKVSTEQLEAFNHILIATIVLIGIVSVLAIVLGILPQDIVIQGVIAIGLIMGMTMLMFIALNSVLKQVEKVQEDKLQALMGILIVTTVLVAVLGILAIVLGSMDTGVIIQGLIAISIIMVLPIVMIKLLVQVSKSASQLPQALLGVAVAGLITVAVAGVAWLIITMMSKFQMQQVLTCGVAIIMTLGLMVLMAAAAFAFAAVAIPLAYATPLALVGIALSSALVVAVAGITRLMLSTIGASNAKNAVLAATAVLLTLQTLVIMASAVFRFAAIAIPLIFAVRKAKKALGELKWFLYWFGTNITTMFAALAPIMGTVDPNDIKKIVGSINQATKSIAKLLAPLVVFNLVGMLIVVNLWTANKLIALMGISLFRFALGMRLVDISLRLFPKNLDFSDVRRAVREMNRFSRTVNSFTAPNWWKMMQLSFTLDYVGKFVRKLTRISESANIEKISGLANSLATLAQNASGLFDLADAISAVAAATNELNDLNTTSKISVEAISGQVMQKANEITNIQKPQESKENEDTKAILEQLTDAVAALQELVSSVGSLTSSTATIANVQSLAARTPQAAFVSD